MHSSEDGFGRRTHYRYGKKASVVVMELGYPSQNSWAVGFGFMKKGRFTQELKPRERYSY
jgi:hypothetical protein